MNTRTTILLSLSAGMAVGIAAIPALKKWSPPTNPSTGTAAPLTGSPALPGTSLAIAAPDEVVRLFLEALSQDDQDTYESYLTTKARSGFGTENGFQLNGEDMRSFETGTVSIDADEASVPVTMTIDEKTQEMSIQLRTEGSDWRIRGAGISMGDGELVIDFESESNPLEAALGSSLESIGGALADGMAQAIEESFENAMAEWSQGSSVESIAAEREVFLSLETTSMDDFEESWRVDVLGAGRTVREILGELLAGSGLDIDTAGYENQLGRTSDIELTGVSRVAAIETLCAEVLLVPVYPDLHNGGEPLGFRAGPREHAVAMTGPFVVEVAELIENAPHTTGELTLSARALGFTPAALAANTEMAEYIDIHRILGSDGSNLMADENVPVWNSPVQENGLFSLRMSVDLHGLLAGVSSIASIEGEASFILPTEVQTFDLPSLEEGVLSIDGWILDCTTLGQDTTLEIKRGGREIQKREVRFAPNAADGSPLGILSQNAWGNGSGLTASLNTPAAPASLTVKLFETEKASSAFELVDVPLIDFADQPGELTALEFEGDMPLLVEFRGFSDRSNPDFPRVELAIHNLSNKEALSAKATFIYLDRRGEELESFPHDLTGEFTFEGQAALSAPGAQATLESIAFFMPRETDTIQVRLSAIEFADGSTWENE